MERVILSKTFVSRADFVAPNDCGRDRHPSREVLPREAPVRATMPWVCSLVAAWWKGVHPLHVASNEFNDMTIVFCWLYRGERLDDGGNSTRTAGKTQCTKRVE